MLRRTREYSTSIHQFRQGMLARARTDGDDHSAWFYATQGLRQRCALLLLLLYALFFSVIHAMLTRLSEKPDTLRGFVHLGADLEEDMLRVHPLTRVQRTVWGMLSADDGEVMCLRRRKDL